MEWVHQVSQGWLHARREVLTATDIIGLKPGLRPATEAQLAGDELIPHFAALWGVKHSYQELDPMSYGAAARGHCCEPFAVKDFNSMDGNRQEMFHWDDCIIVNDGVGFSPDALNIMQLTNDVKLAVNKGKLQNYDVMPTALLEIKSYGIEPHMKALAKTSKNLDERWQIAVAMTVLPTLTEGYLLHYNPSTAYSMIVHHYTRDDLTKEFETIQKIISLWHSTCRWFNSHTIQSCNTTEDEIWQVMQKAMRN